MSFRMVVALAIALLVGVVLALCHVSHIIASLSVSVTLGLLIGVFRNWQWRDGHISRRDPGMPHRRDAGDGNENRFWDSTVRAISWICPGTFLFISSRLIVASFEARGLYVLEGLAWAAAFAAVPFLIRLEGVVFARAVSTGWRKAVSRYPWIERGIPRDLAPASFAVAPGDVRGRDRLNKAKLAKGVGNA